MIINIMKLNKKDKQGIICTLTVTNQVKSEHSERSKK